MKEINVSSHNVPATARSKNYQTAQVTTASSGGGATSPSVVPTTGGAADTAKVAQNLAEDSTDWAKILRKDIDERTENSLSIGKDITVDGKAILNDVVANTGTFAGLLKAESATITGALLASTVNATTVSATTFNGELNGNAATATKLKTARTIWGQSFDGSGNVNGYLSGATTVQCSVGLFSRNICVETESNGSAGSRSSEINNFNSTLFLQHATPNGLSCCQGGGNVGIGTTQPNYKLDVNGNVRIASDLYADATIGTRNFASRTVGWNVNAQGAADFRNIYADELRVQAFTADISQALAGSDYLTKSVSKLSANFVVPSTGGSVRIIVDDIEGMPATQCFSNGDYIRFRAFNRTSGLTIANVWGTVTLDTSFGFNGFSNGTQAYTFTCTATSGAGLTVFKGSEVLDYGASGSGLISRTTLDTMGSPYEQIATWQGDPSNSSNYTVHARLGNLNGISNCNGYGVYTDNGFFTGKITVGDLTKSNNYLDFSSGKLTVQGDIRLSSGYSAVSTFDMSNGISLAVNNIQVGGRNLILNSDKDGSNLVILYGATGTYSETQDMNLPSRNYFSYSNINRTIENYVFYIPVHNSPERFSTSLVNKQIVLTFYIRANNTQILIPNKAWSQYTTESDQYTIGTSWTKVRLSGTYISGNLPFQMQGDGLSSFDISSIKLAEGNKEDGWSLAPEDVDASINLKVSKDGVIGAINLTSEAATISASKINLVGAVTFSAFDSSLQSTINGKAATTYVDSVKNTADNAVANAATAQSTANTANTTLATALGGKTIIVGGYIDTTLINANSITTNKLATNVLSVGNISGLGSLATQSSIAYGSSYLTGKPASLADINSTESTKLGGIASWATVGATWGTNISSIPTNLSALTGSETIKNSLITISSNGTLSGAGGGQVTASGIGACTPTQAQGYAATSQTSAQDNLATQLGYTNYSDLVAKAASSSYGTLAVGGYLNTALIQAQAILTNMLATNAVTADKIAANTITGDKLVMNTITALGNVTAGSFNIGSGKFVVDANGNTTTVNMTAVNATISGTLNGVSGTFNYLQGVGSNGKFWFDNTFEAMSIKDEDFRQLGRKNTRMVRLYASNIRCLGSFGASSLNMARVHDTYIDYYVNGDTYSYVRSKLQPNGVGGYYIQLYPTIDKEYSLYVGGTSLGDVSDFPVDLLIFNNSGTYQYEMLPGSVGKKVIAVNANNNNTLYLAINGDLNDWRLDGGKVATFINIREFMTPSVSSSVHGAGWMMCGGNDNDWA